MRRSVLISLLLLAGCVSRDIVTFSPKQGERITIASGYEFQPKTVRVGGNEFVFSFVPPTDRDWNHTYAVFKVFPDPKKAGYVVLNSDGKYGELYFEWYWIHAGAIKNIKNSDDPIVLTARPWYTGVTGVIGQRLYFTPNARALRYRDWYSMGFKQNFFADTVQRGPANYYCGRAVSTNSGALVWDDERKEASILPKDANWIVEYGCPFRTMDGRDGYWRLTTNIRISGQDTTATRDRAKLLDERLAALDLWLEPMWQSLVIMPQAYQFNPPKGAQQSVYCKLYGLCWNDIKQ